MHKLVMCLNGVPNDDDSENAGMGRHETGVDGLASVCSNSINKRIRVGHLRREDLLRGFPCRVDLLFRESLLVLILSIVLWGLTGAKAISTVGIVDVSRFGSASYSNEAD